MISPMGMEEDDERRSTRKRRAIVEAATAAFLRDGYRGTSMDEVAAKAGVSKQTVYKHFADKERLFSEGHRPRHVGRWWRGRLPRCLRTQGAPDRWQQDSCQRRRDVMTNDELETLAAKQAITEVIYRYCRGLDRMDRALALSVWHPGG